MSPATRAGLLQEMRRALADAGIDNPALDARVLLLHALGIDAVALLTAPEAPVDPGAEQEARRFLARRLEREPVARIIGEKEFFGLRFSLDAATLLPRPDTETVVELALKCLPNRENPHRILDLGVGTGAIAIALLSQLPNAFAIGLDLSPEAARMAAINARRNGVAARFAPLVGSWMAALEGRFDLIVSNPPYIPAGDIAGLERDVRDYDPMLALAGGARGLDAYEAILSDARRLLKPAAVLVLELGVGQAAAVVEIAARHGLEVVQLVADLGGVDRALALRMMRKAV